MSSSLAPIIFWFKRDLRISDHPGFYEATQKGHVIALFIVDDHAPPQGGASLWWLYHSLKSLDQSLDHHLNIYKGHPKDVLYRLVSQNKINQIYTSQVYEPYYLQQDQELQSFFREKGVEYALFSGNLLWEPGEIRTQEGTPYKVFTPFYRQGCLKARPPRCPLPGPARMNLVRDPYSLTTIDQLGLLPSHSWPHKLEAHWKAGEYEASLKLKSFITKGLMGYKEQRNFPYCQSVSRLSPHLHFGEISPQQVWYAVQEQRGKDVADEDIDSFLSELGWREFSYALLDRFPKLSDQNVQKKFDSFPWNHEHKSALEAWQKGQTGYPLVDAGMRELWQTGYMHNRARMIVASFLVKNLMIHWHYGRDWFWDCLVDADLANNSASWQWVAGCGVDAAPYFRIFNPILQGQKFDPEGIYTRHFVPELALLPDKFLWSPWAAPSHILQKAGVMLGKTYPHPIVDLNVSRKRALEAYHNLSR